MALRGLPGCLFGSKSNDCCSPIVVPHGMAHAGLSFGKVRDGAVPTKATSVAALALFLMQMNATGYIYYFDTYAP